MSKIKTIKSEDQQQLNNHNYMLSIHNIEKENRKNKRNRDYNN